MALPGVAAPSSSSSDPDEPPAPELFSPDSDSFSSFSVSVWGEAPSSPDSLSSSDSEASARVLALAEAVADSLEPDDASGTAELFPEPAIEPPAMACSISDRVSATLDVPPAAFASS